LGKDVQLVSEVALILSVIDEPVGKSFWEEKRKRKKTGGVVVLF